MNGLIAIGALVLGYVVTTNKDNQQNNLIHKENLTEKFIPNMSDQVTKDGRIVRYNKVDYADSGTLPVEFVEHPTPQEGLFYDSKASQVEELSNGSPINYGMGTSLTGEPINPAT